MNFSERVEALCRRHKTIKHGLPEPGTGEARRSFFRPDDGEVQEGKATGIHYPCVVMALPFGSIQERGGYVEDRQSVGFEVRVEVLDVRDWASMEAARNAAKRVGEQLLKKLMQEQEEAQCMEENMLMDAVQYSFTGPHSGTSVGCLFKLQQLEEAFDLGSNDNDFNP